MKNFLKQQREVLSLVVYTLVIFVVVYFVIMPLFEKIKTTNDQVQEEILNQEISRKNIEELPKIQKQFESLNQGADLTLVLLDNANAVVLIEKLEKMAEQTNNTISITIEEVSVNDPKKKTPKLKAGEEVPIASELPSQNYLRLKIVLSGKYGSIVKFIGMIENFEYYADIMGIQISKNNEESQLQSISSGSGISNPFVLEMEKDNLMKKNSENILNASINVAFYLRNK
ncbi:MAG: hypothetical protein ACD_8C00066G0002 [uncultured bacterium]|nr:MAG: hypothetical protein ACD_8C00066G0002 [uncultured bacterium]